MKKSNPEPGFKVKRGLDSLIGPKSEITVNDFVYVVLKNNETVHGALVHVGASAITLRLSDYEYTETGIAFTQNLILTKDIKEFGKLNNDGFFEEINWRSYSEGLYQRGDD